MIVLVALVVNLFVSLGIFIGLANIDQTVSPNVWITTCIWIAVNIFAFARMLDRITSK